MQKDQDGQLILASTSTNGNDCPKQLVRAANELTERYKTIEEENEDLGEDAWDDVSGDALDPKEVKRARQEEIDYVRIIELYIKVLVGDAYDHIGKAPISVQWIEIKKSDSECPKLSPQIGGKRNEHE